MEWIDKNSLFFFIFFNKKGIQNYYIEDVYKRQVVDKINEVEKCLETNTVPPKVVETDIDPNATGGRDRVDGASAKVCMY